MSSDSDIGMKDWRKALRTPPAYRVVNRTLRNQTQFVSLTAAIGLTVLFIFYMMPAKGGDQELRKCSKAYNTTYPLTRPNMSKDTYTFRIGIISDLDTNSKVASEKGTWYSLYLKGHLTYSPKYSTVSVIWDSEGPVKLYSKFALKERGMELSELIVFDGRLLSFDDRTGIVYEIVNDIVIPWVILMDGDGKRSKGFKSEWATVKDEFLYVGSMGKEWTTTSGEFGSNDPQFVKVVSPKGLVHHVSWIDQYTKVRAALGIHWPGYMIHESAAWSDHWRRWFFLPRRCSHQRFNDSADEKMGCSVLLSVDEAFTDIKVTKIPSDLTTKGFSSFKFVPGTKHTVIAALRTEELQGTTATYFTVFNTDGIVLLPDTLVTNQYKYEGLEFI